MTAVGETGGAAGGPQHQKVSRRGFREGRPPSPFGEPWRQIAEAFLSIGPDADDDLTQRKHGDPSGIRNRK